MSKCKTEEELDLHKRNSLQTLDNYISTLISNVDPKVRHKADKFCYWLEDYAKYLNYEKKFNPIELKRYKRGEIIRVHLGYNIGSEEGGLHYAVVIDKGNTLSNPIVNIVPLTSIKPNKDLEKLKPGEINLGNELYNNLYDKIKAKQDILFEKIETIKKKQNELQGTTSLNDKKILISDLQAAKTDLLYIENMIKEISRMKAGSIALTNQITTVSKIRIYDPKSDYDVLSNIKLSDSNLDKIDNMIKLLFTK